MQFVLNYLRSFRPSTELAVQGARDTDLVRTSDRTGRKRDMLLISLIVQYE